MPFFRHNIDRFKWSTPGNPQGDKAMFIAHLPSGYLLAKCLKKKVITFKSWKLIFFSAILGGVFPDFDLLYFYFIDNRQNNHHTYMTHIPLYWLIMFPLVSTLLVFLKNNIYLVSWLVFVLGVFVHLILDTVTGGILWYYPLDMHYFSFTTVDEKYNWWVLNFIFHWTFFLEITILFAAIAVYIRARSDVFGVKGDGGIKK